MPKNDDLLIKDDFDAKKFGSRTGVFQIMPAKSWIPFDEAVEAALSVVALHKPYDGTVTKEQFLEEDSDVVIDWENERVYVDAKNFEGVTTAIYGEFEPTEGEKAKKVVGGLLDDYKGRVTFAVGYIDDPEAVKEPEDASQPESALEGQDFGYHG